MSPSLHIVLREGDFHNLPIVQRNTVCHETILPAILAFNAAPTILYLSFCRVPWDANPALDAAWTAAWERVRVVDEAWDLRRSELQVKIRSSYSFAILSFLSIGLWR